MNKNIKKLALKADWSKPTAELARKWRVSYSYAHSLRKSLAPHSIKTKPWTLPRKCELVNVRTGKTLKANSITEFCKKARLYGNSKFHLTPILDGNRLVYKNWMRPEVYHLFSQKVNLKDFYGNKYSLTGFQLRGKLDLTTTYLGAYKFLTGKVKSYRGLYLENTPINQIKPNKKIGKVYLRKGNRIYCTTTSRTDEKHGISYRSVYDLVRGKHAVRKGFEFDHAEYKQQSVLN